MPREYNKRKSASKSAVEYPNEADEPEVSDDTYQSDADENHNENSSSSAQSDGEMKEEIGGRSRRKQVADAVDQELSGEEDDQDDEEPENADDEKSATPVKPKARKGRKGRKGRRKRPASVRRKPNDDDDADPDADDEAEADADADAHEDADANADADADVHTVARRTTHRKVLDTPVPPRSRVRFAIGKNVLARVNRSWKACWIVDTEPRGREVCVRWLNGAKANGGHSDKWVAKRKVHVLSRVQVATLKNGTQTVAEIIQDIQTM